MGSGLTRFDLIRDERPNDTPWPGMTWPPTIARLTGNVVELSPCVPEQDAGPLFRALHDDAVWRHVPGRPKSPEQFTATLATRKAEGRFVWIVRLQRPYAGMATGAIVGTSSYLDVAPTDARLEIGATLYVPAVWGTKVNPDAKLLLLTHAFETLGAGRVQLKTDVRNDRSQRAIARLGARYEGTLRRFQRRDDGTVRDSVLFSIVADDWPDVRERLIARLNEAGHG